MRAPYVPTADLARLARLSRAFLRYLDNGPGVAVREG